MSGGLPELLDDNMVIAALRESFQKGRSSEVHFDLERTVDLLAGDSGDREATMAELTSWFIVYGYVETLPAEEPLLGLPGRLGGRMGRAVWEELSLSTRRS